MSIHRYKYRDAAEAAAACARTILSQLEAAMGGKRPVSLAISGGRSPAPMFREMASKPFAWEQVHLFWVDERGVPPTDPQSNYRMADENFITPANFPRANVHRVRAELAAAEAARLYAADIREFFRLQARDIPQFDVMHRGIGPDAHTASLFPGEPLIDDHQGIAAALWSEKMKQWRITLLPAVLTAAHSTVMLVVEADKADAAYNIFNEPYDPKKYPGQLGMQSGADISWFFDEAAARRLQE